MGQRGTVKCRACGEEFKSSIGGGVFMAQLRCLDCDAEQLVPRDTGGKDFKLRCPQCGGALRNGLLPRCPKCQSRDTAMSRTDMIWD